MNAKTWLAKLEGAEFKILRLQECSAHPTTIDTPEAIVDYVRPLLVDSVIFNADVENLMLVVLSTRRKPIGFRILSQGTLDTLLVHPREVYRSALILNASAIVLVHNHPSGDPTPSEGDIKATRDLIRAGQLLKVELLDHIILGTRTPEREKDYVSLRELGYFYS